MHDNCEDQECHMNMVKLVDQFGSDNKCREYLEELRWPKRVKCPRCNGEEVHRLTERQQFACKACQYHFSVTSGTIFHDSHLSLWKWFLTVYMMIESKKGISANQVKRTLGVSYKTAWYLCHRIRAAMKELNPVPLRGEVEVDETWIGGKARRKGS